MIITNPKIRCNKLNYHLTMESFRYNFERIVINNKLFSNDIVWNHVQNPLFNEKYWISPQIRNIMIWLNRFLKKPRIFFILQMRLCKCYEVCSPYVLYVHWSCCQQMFLVFHVNQVAFDNFAVGNHSLHIWAGLIDRMDLV